MTTVNAVGTNLSGESGSGNFAGTVSPSFTTPDLGTPSALDLTNATNVPASQISGIASPTNGGTGISDPTVNGVLIAEGSSAMNTVVLSDGQLLIGSNSADPVAATLTAGSGIGISNASGAITISNTGSSAPLYLDLNPNGDSNGTIAQSGFVITGTSTSFDSSYIGGLIVYPSGNTTIIKSVSNNNEALACTSLTEADGPFTLTFGGISAIKSGFLACSSQLIMSQNYTSPQITVPEDSSNQLLITGSNSILTSNGGPLILSGGSNITASDKTGGDITIKGGDCLDAGVSGSVNIIAGQNYGTGGTAGSITMTSSAFTGNFSTNVQFNADTFGISALTSVNINATSGGTYTFGDGSSIGVVFTPIQTYLFGVTNNSAPAVNTVGEIIESTVVPGSPVSLTSNTDTNITSISLTAGDWDVWATVDFLPNTGTLSTDYEGGISDTSATMPTSPNGGAYIRSQGSFPAATEQVFSIGSKRIALNSTTTIYLVAKSIFTISTCSAAGYIGARRRR